MEHLRRIEKNLPVHKALEEVWKYENLFCRSPRITFPGSPHADAEDIWLRMDDPSSTDQRDTRWTDVSSCFDLCQDWIWAVAKSLDASRLGRAFLSLLPPGGKILPHTDVGPLPIHYDTEPYWTRLHLVLQGLPGSRFTCGGETTDMLTGELWTFDSALEHHVENASSADRVHLFFDLRL